MMGELGTAVMTGSDIYNGINKQTNNHLYTQPECRVPRYFIYLGQVPE